MIKYRLGCCLLLIPLVWLVSCNKENETSRLGEFKENWYTVSSIDQGTWVFEEPRSSQGNVSYLIAGTARAIMFDAGTGENRGQDGNRILYKIKETTDLPITLLLSHFHFDHNRNIGEFEHVAFPDLDFLRQKVDADNVYSFTRDDLFEGSFPRSVKVSEWLPLGSDIDLGDRMIQVVNLPGHTDESVAIIDHQNKVAFLGDIVYNGALFVFESEDLQVYLSSIERLLTLVDESYVLYGAHSTPLVAHKELIKTRDLLNCIVNSTCYTISSAVVLGKNTTVYQSEDRSATILLIHSD